MGVLLLVAGTSVGYRVVYPTYGRFLARRIVQLRHDIYNEVRFICDSRSPWVLIPINGLIRLLAVRMIVEAVLALRSKSAEGVPPNVLPDSLSQELNDG